MARTNDPSIIDNNCVKYSPHPSFPSKVMAQKKLLCMNCDLDFGYMTLSHDKPLGHGQQLCEILSKSNMAVRSYGLEGYTVTLILEL